MKTEKLVKFSICVRKETREMIDLESNEQNRSRSSMVDIICNENLKEKHGKKNGK